MMESLLYYFVCVNVLTFLVYGIDKWCSTSGRLLPTGRKKARQGKWRISEATLLLFAVIGGSIGAWLGMRVWRHKTMHKKFKYGIPAILMIHIIIIGYLSKWI